MFIYLILLKADMKLAFIAKWTHRSMGVGCQNYCISLTPIIAL